MTAETEPFHPGRGDLSTSGDESDELKVRAGGKRQKLQGRAAGLGFI